MVNAKKFELTRMMLDRGSESITAHVAKLMLEEIDALETKLQDMTTLVKSNLAELSELEAQLSELREEKAGADSADLNLSAKPVNKVRGKSCTEVERIVIYLASYDLDKKGTFDLYVEDDNFHETLTIDANDDITEHVVSWLNDHGCVLSDRHLALLKKYSDHLADVGEAGEGDMVIGMPFTADWSDGFDNWV